MSPFPVLSFVTSWTSIRTNDNTDKNDNPNFLFYFFDREKLSRYLLYPFKNKNHKTSMLK